MKKLPTLNAQQIKDRIIANALKTGKDAFAPTSMAFALVAMAILKE